MGTFVPLGMIIVLHLPYSEQSYQTKFATSQHQVDPLIATVLSDTSSEPVEQVKSYKSIRMLIQYMLRKKKIIHLMRT